MRIGVSQTAIALTPVVVTSICTFKQEMNNLGHETLASLQAIATTGMKRKMYSGFSQSHLRATPTTLAVPITPYGSIWWQKLNLILFMYIPVYSRANVSA